MSEETKEESSAQIEDMSTEDLVKLWRSIPRRERGTIIGCLVSDARKLHVARASYAPHVDALPSLAAHHKECEAVAAFFGVAAHLLDRLGEGEDT